MSDDRKDEVTGVDTTGHEWDGIRELNNPLPRWWLYTFYATILWAIGYVIAYPAIPLIESATPGLLGYSSRGALETQMDLARERQEDVMRNFTTMSLQQIREDPTTFQFAIAGGRAAFLVNCSQCHGTGAAGSPGYPNLNDDDWLWGGKPEDILTTLRHGIRYDRDEDTRFSLMPAFGRDGLLEKQQIAEVTEYVRALSGQEHDANAAAAGAETYEINCAACHGAKGEGDPEQGAPNISDPLWLYGGSSAEIRKQIHDPRHGVMPGWDFRLSDATLKQLSVYVHSLGGGE